MSIRSEIGKIQKIVLHRPGAEHHHFTPENIHEWIPDADGQMVLNPDYLLFDDLVDPTIIAQEHGALSAILASVTKPENTSTSVPVIGARLASRCEMCNWVSTAPKPAAQGKPRSYRQTHHQFPMPGLAISIRQDPITWRSVREQRSGPG